MMGFGAFLLASIGGGVLGFVIGEVLRPPNWVTYLLGGVCAVMLGQLLA